MALTVEDGTGLTTADSYVSVADADAYWSAYGDPSAWTSATTAAKETALRKATAYLDEWYGLRWRGIRAEEYQRLDWPRIHGYDPDQRLIPWAEVPPAVKDATSYLALEALSTDLLPDLSTPGRVALERVKVGTLETETEYQGGSAPLTRRPKVEGMLRRYLRSHGAMRG